MTFYTDGGLALCVYGSAEADAKRWRSGSGRRMLACSIAAPSYSTASLQSAPESPVVAILAFKSRTNFARFDPRFRGCATDASNPGSVANSVDELHLILRLTEFQAARRTIQGECLSCLVLVARLGEHQDEFLCFLIEGVTA